MADLDPLIRLRKHQLDEKQKFLARLYAEADKLLEARLYVLEEIEREKDALRGGEMENFIASSGFGHFLYASRERLKYIEGEERKLDTRIQIALNDMRDSFGDLKKVEITQNNRIAAERKKLQAKEDALFEEIGLQIHNKNQ